MLTVVALVIAWLLAAGLLAVHLGRVFAFLDPSGSRADRRDP